MRLKHLSVKKLCLLTASGMLFSMLIFTFLFYFITNDSLILLNGTILTILALIWFFLLIQLFGNRLSLFALTLCEILDNMINGKEVAKYEGDSETLFSKIDHRLCRLYNIMSESRHKVDKEQLELQELISDISHQVKTPLSNLKMIAETLLTKPVSNLERIDFLHGIQNQIDKLDFLLQALIKTSRLETGIIKLQKKNLCLYNTLAQAMSGIVYSAEKKQIEVIINCPEDLKFPHDSKWTAEAFFNLLDNAVKYTSDGGTIKVNAEQWELYIKVDIADTGKGILEKNQAAIFQRFYREEDVHDKFGVGIGLYLTREIITRQGGYIKVSSKVGKGSIFSVFLPKK